MADFYQKLEGILKQDERFISIEGDLIKSEIINMAYDIDESLIIRLLDDKDTKAKFFKNINGNFIFDILLFVDYVQDKKYLIDSYTNFLNKMGLIIDGRELKQKVEVSLVWPFKDCVLEGSMDHDDGKSKKEIFFNEILAEDEITRLKEPKVLTNGKNYNTKSSKTFDGFNRNETGTITDNLIIKGNNLLALHSLYEEFAGKVKLIYIDPPYNTGNDSFNYNDNFNHSSWLTFMKNRLEIAQKLLRDDGVIFVQIDNSPSTMKQSPEFGYLYVMMDEIFKRQNYLTSFVWKKKGNSSNTKDSIGTITESILLYAKDINSAPLNLQDYKRNYRYEDEDGKVYNLDCCLKTNLGTYERETMQFPIKTKEGTFFPPENKRWTIGEKNIQQYISDGKYVIQNGCFFIKKYPEDYKKGEKKLFNNLLTEHGSLKSAKDEIKELGFNREAFDSPKPEVLMQRILEMGTNDKDIILDYHLGSGTTCAVAHKMGRQYIGIEQMNYIEDIAVERMKKVINGEQGGISQPISWQGGGEFIYFELKEYNEEFINRIRKTKDSKALKKIWEYMKENSFLKYNVDYREEEKIFKELEKLNFEEQQKALISLLDKNHLYVNYSEMEDENFDCTDEEKKITTEFYNKV